MRSQNGWPVLEGNSPDLYTWRIPARNGAFNLRLRRGAPGFVLATFALWFSENIEQVKGATLDDWGWAAPKPIPGTTNYSNHCSGTAMDLNAERHVWRESGTFESAQLVNAIHRKLRQLNGVIRWGGDYQHTVDEMHWEINQGYLPTLTEARRLRFWPRGIRVLRANPSQRGHLA